MNVYEAIKARRTIRDFEDKPVDMGIIERIIDAGLKAPTNNHLRQWEFVIVNDKEERAKVLRVENMTSKDECEKMLDGFGMTDDVQRNMYREAMPRQRSMLYNSGCLILPFFKVREPLLQPSSLSSLNDFASIWCCIENMLLAAASEGILGVTRIPMEEESEHIKSVIGHPENYVMPCYIALGYPAKNAAIPTQKVIHAKDRIHFNSW
ncbi:MAG: nitroreductase family protein [Deltaproteobacteria bacterium]|nr:nitroreductase family protein [Deltaproteobacteria bacterium]